MITAFMFKFSSLVLCKLHSKVSLFGQRLLGLSVRGDLEDHVNIVTTYRIALQ